MKRVLDASVGLKFGLFEPGSDKARRLQDEFRKGLHEFLAPDVYPAEVGHALTRAQRKRLIPEGHAAVPVRRYHGSGARSSCFHAANGAGNRHLFAGADLRVRRTLSRARGRRSTFTRASPPKANQGI